MNTYRIVHTTPSLLPGAQWIARGKTDSYQIDITSGGAVLASFEAPTLSLAVHSVCLNGYVLHNIPHEWEIVPLRKNVSTADIARTFNISAATVSTACRKGELQATKDASGRYIVDEGNALCWFHHKRVLSSQRTSMKKSTSRKPLKICCGTPMLEDGEKAHVCRQCRKRIL